jgi:hypothetical protein
MCFVGALPDAMPVLTPVHKNSFLDSLLAGTERGCTLSVPRRRLPRRATNGFRKSEKRALATREAHLALLDLKKFVDEATQTTHAAELEAVSLAIRQGQGGDSLLTLRVVIERLQSPNLRRRIV